MNHLHKVIRYKPIESSVFFPIEGGDEKERLELSCYTSVFSDPTNELMLHYVVHKNDVDNVYFRELGASWIRLEPYKVDELLMTDYKIYWFKLSELNQDTIYETRMSGSVVNRIKTLKVHQPEEFKVVMLSDQMNVSGVVDKQFENLSNILKEINPDLIAINGDVVHDDAHKYSRWVDLWEGWGNHVLDSDGNIIPIMATLGNHDGAIYDNVPMEDRTSRNLDSLLWHRNGATSNDVPFFYSFFSTITPDNHYRKISISDYINCLVLNSGHTIDIKGEQTTWIENELINSVDRHVFPFFHVSPYPSRYGYNYRTHVEQRENWSPLFSQHGVKFVGNGHEHISFATKRVTGDSLDANGVIYSGQGNGIGTDIREFRSHFSVDNDPGFYIDYMKDNSFDLKEVQGFDLFTFKDSGNVKLEKMLFTGDTVHSIVL